MSTPDPRQASKVQHPQSTLWLLVLFAIACRQNNILAISQWIDHHAEFLLDYLGCRTQQQARLPSQATLYRFFWQLEQQRELLEGRIRQWAQVLARNQHPGLVQVSIDGKVARGSRRARAGQSAIELLSMYLTHLGVTLHQERLTGRESTQARGCLKYLRALGGFLVTGDAAYLDKHFVRAVVRSGGEYLVVVGNNAPDVLESAAWVFTLPEHSSDTRFVASEVRSGEVWTWSVRTRLASPELTNAFPGAQQFVQCQREVFTKATGEVRTETDYALTSTLLPASELAPVWRSHWAVENRSHHKRDVIFGEDACRSRKAAEVLAALRNVVLAVFHAQGERQVLERVRYLAARPQELPAFFGWPS